MNNKNNKSVQARQGFTLVEMIMAMSVAALLAVAVGVALNASFIAYSNATEMASVQTSARLVSQRLLPEDACHLNAELEQEN